MSQRHHPLVRILSSVVWWGAWIVMRSAGLAVLPHPARVRISPQSAHLVHRHDDQAVRPPVVPMAGVCDLDVDADTDAGGNDESRITLMRGRPTTSSSASTNPAGAKPFSNPRGRRASRR
jgi:hypothetical protein